VSSALSVRRRQISHAIDIGFTVSTPDKAANMANTLTDLYLNSMVESRLSLARHRDLWLAQRTEELREDLARKEQALSEYRAKTGQLGVDGATLPAIRARAIEDSALELIRTSAEKRARLAQVEQVIKNGGSLDSIAEVLNSATIRDLRGRQIEVSRQQAELAQRYSAAHPDRVKAEADREAVDREIRTELGRITTSLRNEVAILESQRQVLNGHQNAARTDMDRNSAFMTTLNALERDAATTRQVYESYLRSGQELQDQATLKPLNARLMSLASPPLAPAGPGAAMILLALVIIGAILGIAAALVMTLMDDRLYSVDDVERRLNNDVLAAIHELSPPYRRLLPRKFTRQDSVKDQAAFEESFRFLRLALQSKLRNRSRVVAVTSSTTSEGKTTVASRLAQSFGDSGKRVLLLECDIRHASLTQHIGHKKSAGLLAILENQITWRECLAPVTPGVEAILGVGKTAQSLDWRHADALHTMLDEMRNAYDLVLLDCPPVLALAEATMLSQAADGVLFVTRLRHTSASEATLALKQLSAAGCTIFGVVANRLDPFALGANAGYFNHVQKYYI
jgi:capsular exopolysaccharide synthesis family protein